MKEPHQEELRRQLKLKLAARRARFDPGGDNSGSLMALVQELETQEIELEVQNQELRRVRDELENTRDSYRDLYELSPIAFVTTNEEGYVAAANHAVDALLGCDRGAVIGQPLSRFLPAVDADHWYLQLRGALAAPGTRKTCELSLVRADGGHRLARVDTVALPGAPDRPCLTTLVDLSQREQLAQALRDSESESREHLVRFETLAARIEEVFYLARADGRLVYLSRAFETMFGRPAEHALGRPNGWLPWVHADDRGAIAEAREGLADGRDLDLEYRIVQPAGEVRIVRERAFFAGKEQRVTGIVQDVTTARKLARQLEERHTEKMEAVGRLSSGIAHDFNNLLMGMIGYGQMAMSHLERSSPAYGYVQRSLHAAQRGTSLTRQLLAFAHKRSSTVEVPIELDAAVVAATSLTERLVGAHIGQRMSTGAPGRHVLADPGEIEQILINLAANARDAMPKGGQLTIATSVVKLALGSGDQPGKIRDCICLTIADTGPGMDEATQDRLFEPFFTTKDVGKGTGLGLATVFGIVQRRGGKIHVVSEIGHGTEFFIHFPIVPPPPPAEASERAREPARGTGTLLVVEDDDLVRTTVRSYLTRLGYDVMTAASAEEAMYALKAGHRLDAMITDVVMPERLGTEFAAEVRQRFPSLAIIFMSAHPREDLESRVDLPTDAILLEKPFDQRALGRRSSRHSPAPRASPDLGLTGPIRPRRSGCRSTRGASPPALPRPALRRRPTVPSCAGG